MKLEQLYKNGRNNQADCDNFLDHYYSIFETKIKNSYPNLDEDEIEEKMTIVAEMLNDLYKDYSNVSFIEFDLICNTFLNEVFKTFSPNYIKEDFDCEDDKLRSVVLSSLRYYLSQVDDSRSL